MAACVKRFKADMRAANAGLEEVASLLTGAEAAMEQRQADMRRKQAAEHKTVRRVRLRRRHRRVSSVTTHSRGCY